MIRSLVTASDETASDETAELGNSCTDLMLPRQSSNKQHRNNHHHHHRLMPPSDAETEGLSAADADDLLDQVTLLYEIIWVLHLVSLEMIKCSQ